MSGGSCDESAGIMRTICDVCESAPAILFCAADEAALCRPCDEKRIEGIEIVKFEEFEFAIDF
ncbi:hypothetical protein ACLOJK_027849 [Asimina triloba]